MKKHFIFIFITLFLFTTSCSNKSLPNESIDFESNSTTVETSSDDVQILDSNTHTTNPTEESEEIETLAPSKSPVETAMSETNKTPTKANPEKSNSSSKISDSKKEPNSSNTTPNEEPNSNNAAQKEEPNSNNSAPKEEPNSNNAANSDNDSATDNNSCNHDNGKLVWAVVDPQPDPNGCGTILYGVHKCISCKEIVGYTGDDDYLPHRDTHEVADASKNTCQLNFYNSVCNVCGEIREGYFRGSGRTHNFSEWSVASSPTCLDEQLARQRSCTNANCDEVETQNVWINPGDYHNIIHTNTVPQEGGFNLLYYECTICELSYSEHDSTPWLNEGSSGYKPSPGENTTEPQENSAEPQ